MSSKSHPVLEECCLFIRQCYKKRRAFFDNAHVFKHIELSKGMLYVKETDIAQIYIAFSKSDTAPLGGDMCQRAWCIF